MNTVLDALRGALPYVPSVVTLAVVITGLFLLQRLLSARARRAEGHRFRDQMLMLAATVVALVIIVMALPISEATRGQLLGLLGILLSAAIALSSTTVLGNAVAGLMLRGVRNFRIGDFIRVGEHFGRVSERGLFHTEIQTVDRELTTLPNMYLATTPVTTIRSSGTIVSATVSLGYDVPRERVEELLLSAAKKAELDDPFVQVLELSDFSVLYRVAGMLTDVKKIITARSRLRKRMVDTLHDGGVEIVSPNFMSQRVYPADTTFVPQYSPRRRYAEDEETSPEDLVFDKAEEAEVLEALRSRRERTQEDLAGVKKKLEESSAEPEKEELAAEAKRLETRIERLDIAIAARAKRVEG